MSPRSLNLGNERRFHERLQLRANSGHSLLWGFLNGNVLFEGDQLLLDALERVGEIALLQLLRLVPDPLQQVRHQLLVAHLTQVRVPQLFHDL